MLRRQLARPLNRRSALTPTHAGMFGPRTAVRPQHTPQIGPGGRLALLRSTPLRKLRCVPLRIAVGATDDCRRSSAQGHAKRVRKGERPLPPYPPEDAPGHLPGRDAVGASLTTAGKQTQIRDTPRLSAPTHAVGRVWRRPPPLRYTTVRCGKVHRSVILMSPMDHRGDEDHLAASQLDDGRDTDPPPDLQDRHTRRTHARTARNLANPGLPCHQSAALYR